MDGPRFEQGRIGFQPTALPTELTVHIPPPGIEPGWSKRTTDLQSARSP